RAGADRARAGEAAAHPLGAAPDTAHLPAPPAELLARLNAHPTVQMTARQVALARADLTVAGTTKTPDWSLLVSYGQRSPNFSNMISVFVSIDVPVAAERRQDRDIAGRRALVDRANNAVEDARRIAEAEARGLVADCQAPARFLKEKRCDSPSSFATLPASWQRCSP
ncbi:MAG: hypothetical protein ACREVR_15735, partial [Burkholderiales bacterium]